MSKIICEVCGTSYPDTAAQCPICGCVRPADAPSVAGDTAETAAAAGTYNYVKGGRFSKANVRKRNRENYKASAVAPAADDMGEPEEKKGNKGLVITALILLLAILAVVVYLCVRFFLPAFGLNDPAADTKPNDTAASTTQSTTVSCEDVKLDVSTVTFDTVGDARMIYVTLDPIDTTDEIIFTSSDESVATVSADGKIVAVASGKAVITVQCGKIKAECKVECVIPEETTEDTTIPEDTTEPSEPIDEEFKLNRSDITFSSKGSEWMLYDGKVSVSSITWTSDDESVATIKNGKVVAVGPGTTKVHGEYNGEKVSCIIRCSFSDSSSGIGGSGGGISEDGGGTTGSTTGGNYKLYTGFGNEASDVTISVGSSFTLHLKNDAGEYASVTWSVSDTSVCSVSDNSFTGIAAGTVSATAVYDGVTYSCIIRVKG